MEREREKCTISEYLQLYGVSIDQSSRDQRHAYSAVKVSTDRECFLFSVWVLNQFEKERVFREMGLVI